MTESSAPPTRAWIATPIAGTPHALRDATLAQLRGHLAADEIVRGEGYGGPTCRDGGYRGCALGCLTHRSDGGHALLPARYGLPVWLGRLADSIFEGLPAAHAPAWAIAWVEAVPVGADLEWARPRILRAILTGYTEPAGTAEPREPHATRGALRHTRQGSAQRAAVERVVALLDREIAAPGSVTWAEWADASRAATATAADAATATATAAAAATAADAADAAAATDAYATVYATADAAYATADAARRAYWRWLADTVLGVLAACPVAV